MNLLRARIHWHEGYFNAPVPICLVDEIPDKKTLTYKVLPGYEDRVVGPGTLYSAESGGLISNYLHFPEDEDGCGGAEMTLKTEAGTVTIRGPWVYAFSRGVMALHGVNPAYAWLTTSEEQFFNLVPGGESEQDAKPAFIAAHYVTEEFWTRAVDRCRGWIADVVRTNPGPATVRSREITMAGCPPKSIGPGDRWEYVHPRHARDRMPGVLGLTQVAKAKQAEDA